MADHQNAGRGEKKPVVRRYLVAVLCLLLAVPVYVGLDRPTTISSVNRSLDFSAEKGAPMVVHTEGYHQVWHYPLEGERAADLLQSDRWRWRLLPRLGTTEELAIQVRDGCDLILYPEQNAALVYDEYGLLFSTSYMWYDIPDEVMDEVVEKLTCETWEVQNDS